jgi:hypothetical protein
MRRHVSAQRKIRGRKGTSVRNALAARAKNKARCQRQHENRSVSAWSRASHGEYRIVTEGIIAFPPTERRCGESKLLVLWVAAWKSMQSAG